MRPHSTRHCTQFRWPPSPDVLPRIAVDGGGQLLTVRPLIIQAGP